MTHMKQALAILLVLCLAAVLPVSALGEAEALALTPLGDSRFLCEYGSTSRRLLIDLPEKTAGSGLILMLHGYGGTAESFHLDTGFAEAALERGYTVVWVTGTPPGEYVAELGDCLRESYVWTWRWLCALAKSLV